MKKLHHHLRQKYHWYDSWHKHPKHNLFHWLGLIAFSELAFLFAVTITLAAAHPEALNITNAKVGCDRPSNPSIIIGDSQIPLTAHGVGLSDTLVVDIKNNDTGCGDERFITDISVSDKAHITITTKRFTDVLGSGGIGEQSNSLSHNVIFTPQQGITAGTYGITIRIRNASKPAKATEVTIPYVINGAGADGSVCVHNSPDVKLDPTDQSGTPGQSLNYLLTYTNKDTGACPDNRFTISSTSDDGLQVNSTQGIKLSPGGQSSPTVVVSSDSRAQPKAGGYKFQITVTGQYKDSAGMDIAQSVSGNYQVISSVVDNPNCVRGDPLLEVLDHRKYNSAGETLTYNIKVTNTDKNKPSKTCGGSRFMVSARPTPEDAPLNDWAVTPATFSLEPGVTYPTSINIKSAATADARDYHFLIYVTNVDSNRSKADTTVTVYAVTTPNAGDPAVSIVSPQPTHPDTNTLDVHGDFAVLAQVTNAYKVDKIVMSLDGFDKGSCAYTGVSSCNKTISVAGLADGAIQELIVTAKKNGVIIGHAAHLTIHYSKDTTVGIGAKVNIYADHEEVTAPGSVTISWAAVEISPSTCQASSNPANAQWNSVAYPTTSKLITGLMVDTDFTITCSGYLPQTVQVKVNPAPPAPNPACPNNTPTCLTLSGVGATGLTLHDGDQTLGNFSITATVHGNLNLDRMRLNVDGPSNLTTCDIINPVDGTACTFNVDTTGWHKDPHTVTIQARKNGGTVTSVTWTLYQRK